MFIFPVGSQKRGFTKGTAMKAALTQLMIETLLSVSENLQIPDEGLTPDTLLFGRNGILDSIGLVTFVIAVEQEIEEQFGSTVTLTDEKAFSQKNSPFRTIDALAAYTAELIGIEAQ